MASFGAVVCGYAGAAGLGAAGYMYQFRANKQSRFASHLELGLNNALPKEGDKTTYVALSCIGTPHQPISLFPSASKVLLGRSTIEKAGWRLFSKSARASVPGVLLLKIPEGTVNAHRLDHAKWFGAKEEKYVFTPKEALQRLKGIGMGPDGKSSYSIKSQWFEGDRLTIFAALKMKYGRYKLKAPKGGLPFVVTTKDPLAFALEARSKEARLKKNDELCKIGTVTLASGTRVFQLLMERLEDIRFIKSRYGLNSVSTFPQSGQMFAFAGLCAVSAWAAVKSWSSRSKDNKSDP